MSATASQPTDFFGRHKNAFAFAAVPVAFSGNYTSGGDPFNLAAAINATLVPLIVLFSSKNGYLYAYVPGADATAGKIKVNSAVDTELAAGAYPAGVTGDVVTAFVAYKPNV